MATKKKPTDATMGDMFKSDAAGLDLDAVQRKKFEAVKAKVVELAYLIRDVLDDGANKTVVIGHIRHVLNLVAVAAKSPGGDPAKSRRLRPAS